MEPIFKNSPDVCPNCTFLGSFQGEDLYFCSQGGHLPTVMAIQSEEPGDYVSGIYSKDAIPSLGAAYLIAKERGLIKNEGRTELQELKDTLRIVKKEIEDICKSTSAQGCGVCPARPREFCRWGKLLDKINEVI